MKINKIILIVYMVIICVCLCGCTNKEDEGEINKKIQSEIEYLDKKIIGLMNKLNNITLENYEVKSKEIEPKKQNNSSDKGSSNSSTEGNSSKDESIGEESSKEENSSDNSNSGESSGENNGTSKSIKVLQMQPSNILVIDKDDIDWMTIKSETETIYSSWNSILLDLYSINLNKEDILGFSKSLDNAILLIKAQDKQGSLEALANLYSYLPKYVNELPIEESKKNIMRAKNNVMNAYAYVNKEAWNEVQNQINEADMAYKKVLNDVNYIKDNQQKVEKIYVSLNELKNSINLQDKDIFYIKYKNLINSIQ